MQHHESDEAQRFAREQEEMRALLAGVALGVTTPAENARVEAYMNSDPDAAREVAEYRALADGMLLSVPALEPPAGALDRLLAATRPLGDQPAGDPTDGLPNRVMGEQSPRQGGVAGWLLAPRVSLAALAAALIVALGVIGYLALELSEARRIESDLWELAQEQEAALTLMRRDDVGWVKLNNPQDENGASPYAWLIYSPGEQSGVILTNNFPPLQQDMAYQLWAGREEDGPVSLGTFRVRGDGTACYRFWMPENITEFERMGITAEPDTGSPGPTSPAVVRLDLAQFNERMREAWRGA